MKKIVLFILLWAFTLSAFALDALHIKELAPGKGNTESAGEFLAQLPSSFEAQLLYMLVGAGLIGLIGSWLDKWRRGVADGLGHFYDEAGSNIFMRLRYPIGQVIWLVSAAVGLIATLGFVTDDGVFWGWMSVMANGLLLGWAGEVKTEPRT